jgi:probable rRNA maturation factor
VLAFALREGEPVPGAEGQLGDIVISLETAQRQANDHDRTLWQEVSLLLAHGLLHLIGYDHHTAAEERRMNARADMLIAACTTRRPQVARGTVDKRSRSVDKPSRKGVRKAPSGRRKT